MADIPFSYKATGYLVGLLDSLFKSNIHVEGIENIVDKPTLFVVNHFTRSETFLLPYIILKYRNEMVHSLADASLFSGKLGDYLRTLGAISTKSPFRNRIIIQELMQGKFKWVIFPEGIMVKNKKIFEKGRFMLDHPDRKGPPRTGASVLALKAELYKRNYLNASKRNDRKTMEFYEKRYNFEGAQDLSFKDIVINPVNITYYPVRPEENFFSNMVNYFVKDMPPRIEEELKIEGQLLLSKTDISVHFGKAISLHNYLDKIEPLTRVFMPFVSEEKRTNLIISWQKRRLTRDFMHEIYTKVAVNIDHIFACCLRYRLQTTIDYGDLARAIFLAATLINRLEHRRVHPSLSGRLINIITNETFEPLTNILQLSQKEKAIVIGENEVMINHEALHKPHPFHSVRLTNLISVFANEIEPLKYFVKEIKKLVNQPKAKLKKAIVDLLVEREQTYFEIDYKKYHDKERSHPEAIGRPFYLKSKKSNIGIVLSHGYLSAPEEIRALANHLHAKGFSVYGVRLKGHGTAPHQLAEVTHEDWIESYNRAFAILKNDCEHVVVGGFSAGGLLALLAAANKQKSVKGVFCINAAIKLNDIKSHLVPTVMVWNQLLDSFNIEKGKLEYIENNSENPDINYSRNYLNGVRELGQLISLTRSKLSSITAPSLIVQADNDPVVSPKSADIIYDNINAEQKEKFIVDFDRHVIVRKQNSEKVFNIVSDFMNKISVINNSNLDND